MWTLLVVFVACVFGSVSWAAAQESAQETSVEHPKELSNSIGMKLVLIPKGTFMMGCPTTEVGGPDYAARHEVTISQSYYLGIHEVTQDQYKKVMGQNPSRFTGSKNPVEQVSWDDAVEFCERLSELPEEKKAGRVYRLPTEAEWEYACRAGSQLEFSFGDNEADLGDYGWFGRNSNDQTQPVGEKKPNAWGLYDMHGNVWEWCSDWDSEYPKGAVTDPVGPEEGSVRVFRGGGYYNTADGCWSSLRIGSIPANRVHFIGFRVALSPSSQEQAEPDGDR